MGVAQVSLRGSQPILPVGYLCLFAQTLWEKTSNQLDLLANLWMMLEQDLVSHRQAAGTSSRPELEIVSKSHSHVSYTTYSDKERFAL
jgi:hypothetical protein